MYQEIINPNEGGIIVNRLELLPYTTVSGKSKIGVKVNPVAFFRITELRQPKQAISQESPVLVSNGFI